MVNGDGRDKRFREVGIGDECPKHPSDDYIPQQSPEGHTTYSGHKECNGEWSGSITINFSGGFFSGPLGGGGRGY